MGVANISCLLRESIFVYRHAFCYVNFDFGRWGGNIPSFYPHVGSKSIITVVLQSAINLATGVT